MKSHVGSAGLLTELIEEIVSTGEVPSAAQHPDIIAIVLSD